MGGEKSIPIDIQIIAATNKNLKEAVKEGAFRSDLYYRLNVFPIYIPPLRNRREDIIPLVDHFVQKLNQKYKLNREISTKALKMLKEYDWPGNVRELENLVERLILTAQEDLIDEANLSPLIFNSDCLFTAFDHEYTMKEAVEKFEKEFLVMNIKKCKKPEDLCNVLNISRSTFNRKINKYKLRKFVYM